MARRGGRLSLRKWLLVGSIAAALVAVAAPAASAAIWRVSVPTDGGEGNSHSDVPVLSANGRYVAFQSWASNLVAGDTNASPLDPPYWGTDVFVHDRRAGLTRRVSVASNGAQANDSSGGGTLSADGRYVA